MPKSLEQVSFIEQYLDEGHPLYTTMNELLPHLDTGIAHLGGEEISFDNIPLPEPLKSKLQEDVKEGMTVRLLVLDFTILDLRIQAQQGLSLQIADTVLIKREFHG
jgi:hypothetical protein